MFTLDKNDHIWMRQGIQNYFSVSFAMDYLKIMETRIKHSSYFGRINYINCRLMISNKVVLFIACQLILVVSDKGDKFVSKWSFFPQLNLKIHWWCFLNLAKLTRVVSYSSSHPEKLTTCLGSQVPNSSYFFRNPPLFTNHLNFPLLGLSNVGS